MSCSECGKTERPVRFGVLGVPDSDHGLLEQPDRGGEHLLPRYAGPSEVRGDAGADPRQRLREVREALVLGVIAHLAPTLVIAVLLRSCAGAVRRLCASWM